MTKETEFCRRWKGTHVVKKMVWRNRYLFTSPRTYCHCYSFCWFYWPWEQKPDHHQWVGSQECRSTSSQIC